MITVRQQFHKTANQKARDEEAALLPSLRAHFKDHLLTQSVGTFDRFDFVSPTRKIELKTRTCLVDTYPDLMIGANKIAEARRNHNQRDHIFCFKFADGSVYYWIYDPAVFLPARIGGRTDRGMDERKEHFFIPTNVLEYLPIVEEDKNDTF